VCAGILLGVPLLAGFVLSRIVADPLFVVIESKAPMAFAPTDAQKVCAPLVTCRLYLGDYRKYATRRGQS